MSSQRSASLGTACLVLRLVLGVIMVPHGMQKLFAAFGGPGLGPTADFFVKIGLVPGLFWAWVAGLVEFAGGICLVVGFLTRVAAFLVAVQMATAVLKVHVPGFFVDRGGMEFALALGALAVAVLLLGGGPLSVDRAIGIERKGDG
ncbi:MAG: DoxX family protein [Candidatus Rokubacteria bacterium]|nr:DoxX family protein [Candidatus Rokubacteria bacterium]